MTKKISLVILLGIICLLLIPNIVNAIEVEDTSEFKTALQDKATISGNTITLTDNVVLTDKISVLEGTYVLDLAEHSITGTIENLFEITNASLTIKNGTISSDSSSTALFKLYEKSNIIIESGNYSAKYLLFGAYGQEDDGYYASGEEPNVIIKNGTFSQLGTGIIISMYGGNVTIKNGTFYNTNVGDEPLLYFDSEYGALNVTIDNGTFTNEGTSSLLSISGGNFTINSGSYTSTYETLYINNKCNVHGEDNKVNIKGGQFTGNNAILFDGNDFDKIDSMKLVIDGGTFDSTEYVTLDINSGEAIVNGGTFTSTENYALDIDLADVTINEGTFISNQYTAVVLNEGKLTINGGTFTGFYDGLTVYDYERVDLKLYGGTYTATNEEETENYGGINIESDTETDELILSLLGEGCVYSPNTITNQFVDSAGDTYTKTATPVTVLCPKTVTMKNNIKNGTIVSSKTSALPGEEVTLTITPKKGYKLKSIKVLDKFDEQSVTVTNNKFIMPSYNVFITAEFVEDIINPKTGDGIMNSILFGSISIFGILGCGLILNKKKRYN